MTFSKKPPRYPTLHERHLTRMLSEEREVNHGLYAKSSFLLSIIRRVGEILQIPNSQIRRGNGES